MSSLHRFFLLLAMAFLSTPAVSAAQPKRILIINSFGSTSPPFSFQATTFKSSLLAKMKEPVDLDEVSLDMARYDVDMEQPIVDYLRKRHAKFGSELVVPIGAPAANFVAKYRDQLFPESPILYAAADRRLLPPDALDKNAAYVGQTLNIPGLFEDMLQVAPKTNNIEIVVGSTPLEYGWTEAFKKAAEPLADRIKFTYYNDLSFEEMLARVSTLPPDSYILFLLLLRDSDGVTINADEALQRLHAVARAPINALFSHQLGKGIVGGRLLQSDVLGNVAADVAVGILNGKSPSEFPPALIENLSPHYDWRELRRWNIDASRLPPGSTILFREPTIWEQYKEWIIGAASLFVLQAALITGLVANRLRRRKAERSLGESEARFRNMADTAPVLVWMSGPDKLGTFFNKVWLSFTGRTAAQEMGHGWMDGVHPDDRERCLAICGSAFDKQEPFTMQFRLRRHDGAYRTVTDKGVPRYDAARTFLGYIGACIDITEQLEQQKALHQIEERVALATEAAHLGVWELNPDTDEFWVSDKIYELFDLPRHKPPSYEEFTQRVHPEDRARRAAASKAAIQDGRNYELEYRILLPDGTLRWISGRGHCIAEADGKSCRLLGVSMDVTSRKLAEEQAARNRDQIDLLSRVSLLGEMTASLAHELNQPLSAIVSNANAGTRFIDKGKADLEVLREIMVDVEADGRRAHDIINSVRQTIKKGADSAATRQPINLNDTIDRVIHMVQPDATAHACEIETSLAEDLPPIDGDPGQIQQVLINLMSNAFDSMSETARARRKLNISTETNGDGTIRLSVRDRGAGIPREIRGQIFDQFFTTKEEGLGMGLAIVRSIVESHGGKIAADNESEGGARFCVTLPITRNHHS